MRYFIIVSVALFLCGCITRNRTDMNPNLTLSLVHVGDVRLEASSSGGNLDNQTKADGNTATTDANLGLNRGEASEDAAENLVDRINE